MSPQQRRFGGNAPPRPHAPPPSRAKAPPPQAAPPAQAPTAPAPGSLGPVQLPQTITVQELATRLKISGIDLIKQLMRIGIMANLSQAVNFDTAATIAASLGYRPMQETAKETATVQTASGAQATGNLQTRPPIVTILGHVDHGKTSLLDAIRKTKVAASEAGGITQHIGAYQVAAQGKPITFLDTPGHEAFTAMRARGAKATDIAILVVAADDGVMPQTIEAMDHAKAANVPVIVAINKIDKPEADPNRVKTQLLEKGLLLEEFGGQAIGVPVSAKTGKGIQDLLDTILLVAEVADLKADPDQLATGVIIEAHVDRSRGPVASILVQNGTLSVGDPVVAGDASGKIRALLDDQGKRLKSAGPSTPVEVLGFTSIPKAGDPVIAFASDAEMKAHLEKLQAGRKQPMLAKGLLQEVGAGTTQHKELPLIIKTDVQGSVDPVRNSVERTSTEKAKVRVLHAAAGSINESDVLLAVASKAMIVGFNSKVEPGAKRLAESEGVPVRTYDIIYTMVEDMKKALEGILEPVFKEVIEGHAEVRASFKAQKRLIAGCYITDGKAARGSSAKVLRKNKVIGKGAIVSLRRFKDDVREVTSGLECGVGVEDIQDFQEGDRLEFFRLEKQG